MNNTSALMSIKVTFIESKDMILRRWVSCDSVKVILELHNIDEIYFLDKYANGVFDYFMDVISNERETGSCPIMENLLAYLKHREISADELFEICSRFRRSMLDFSYDTGLSARESFNELSHVFDQNFRGILKFYTDNTFQKLIDARQEALVAVEAKDHFLYNTSHEIRTPLNAMLGFVNILMEEDISSKHKSYLDIIHNSGKNLLSIIDDILDFSKLRSGEFVIIPSTFYIHDEISKILELFVASASEKNITILAYLDPKISKELYADSLRIKQILSNFLSNAIKFTELNGIISVNMSCEDKKLRISVEDNGIGISPEDLKNIFTAFTQTRYSEHKDYEGTGLGLSICSQLADHMNGYVDVVSTLGVGSTFWMEIPVEIYIHESKYFENIEGLKDLKFALYAKNKRVKFTHEAFLKYADSFGFNIEMVDNINSDADITLFVNEESDSEFKNAVINSDKKYIALMSMSSDDYEEQKHIASMCFPLYYSKINRVLSEVLFPKNLSSVYSHISKKFAGHVLVAEDDRANQELIKILFSKYGLSFDLANNGEEAYNLFKKNSYDLVFMDEQMPVMDGYKSVEMILKHEQKKGLKHTPISALTANVAKGERAIVFSKGFDAFLGKPIVIKDLEHLFGIYLKRETVIAENKKVDDTPRTIVGLDAQRLHKELMLTHEELIMLLRLFITKSRKLIPKLKHSIATRDYRSIALSSHSIKGSSANFRMESLQNISTQMEKMASEEKSDFDYESAFVKIQKILEEIRID